MTRSLRVAAYLWLSALGLSCGILGPESSNLRVHNVGSSPLVGLSVLFPESSVEFGDVSVGATTEYRVAAKGVYSYGAFRFTHNGSSTVQPVIDWVGEEPMEGQRFTYNLELTTNGANAGIILVSVTKDR